MAKFGFLPHTEEFEMGRLLVNHGLQFCVGAPRLPRISHFCDMFTLFVGIREV